MTLPQVRPVQIGDLPAIRELYNHFVRHTAITFDLEEVSHENRLRWFAQFGATGRYRLLAAFNDGALTGYAYSSRYRAKAAYDTSVETTVYTAPSLARRGVGGALYGALFEILAAEEVHRAFAVITKPNAASEAFHRAMGFREVGVLDEVGFKFGRYHCTGYWQKTIGRETP